MRAIERAPGGRRHRHTFVFAAFVGDKPRVATIPNFQECTGRSEEAPWPELRVDSREMGQGPRLVVTGQRRAVARTSRRLLERVAARSDASPARIRNTLTQMNAAAACAPEAGNTVSVGCSVVSFRRDGTGFQDLTGGSTATLRSLMNGQPIPDVASLLGFDPGRVRGATFIRGSARERQLYTPCVPRTVTPDAAAAYQLTELTHAEFETVTARDVNDRMAVLGSGTRPRQPGKQLICMWDGKRSAQLTGFTGQPSVRGLSDSGDIAVTADMTDGSVHAIRWSPGEETQGILERVTPLTLRQLPTVARRR